MEGMFSTVVRSIEAGSYDLSRKDIATLRQFSMLQYVRTAKAVKRISDATTGLMDATFAGKRAASRKPDQLTKEQKIHLALSPLT